MCLSLLVCYSSENSRLEFSSFLLAQEGITHVLYVILPPYMLTILVKVSVFSNNLDLFHDSRCPSYCISSLPAV